MTPAENIARLTHDVESFRMRYREARVRYDKALADMTDLQIAFHGVREALTQTVAEFVK